ncbi:MAG TPA: DUF2188 domain-containing protein [Thermoanaerobaculia bacterium]
MPSTQKSTTQQSSSPPKKPKTKSKSAAGASKNGSRITKGKVIAGAAGLAAAAAATAGAVLYKKKGGSESRAVFHVKPQDDGWVVKGDGAERASSTHGTKKEALAAGRELAHQRVPSQLVVHKSDGKVQETWSYDPT